MVTDWRMRFDFEKLAEIPDGVLYIDLLKRTNTHSKAGNLDLMIADDLASWMNTRLTKYGIPASELTEALVEVEFRTDLVPTDKNRIIIFDFRSKSRLVTAKKTYEQEYFGSILHRRPGAPLT